MKEEEDFHHSNPLDGLAYRTAYLIMGFIEKNQTAEELEELDEWICSSDNNQALFEELIDEENLAGWRKWREQLPVEQRYESSISKRYNKPVAGKIFAWIAAAAVLLLVISFWWLNQQKPQEKIITAQVHKSDIQPGGGEASLRLADGSVIMLDSAAKGVIGSQGHVQIVKNDSEQLTYQRNDTTEKPMFNTLTVPKGGQYTLVLPDGTKVWLNAATAITYPTAFTGSTRKVILTGEAYFEVAHNAQMPFVVNAGETAIKVLGTHFNVHAYPDEPLLKVSLAEGSVSVLSKTLVPGQQARIGNNNVIKIVPADLEADLAWKNGTFLFRETPLEEIMKQVERWYGADIVYDSEIRFHFNATIARNVPVSKLLELLEQTGSVHFKIEDKKITVMK